MAFYGDIRRTGRETAHVGEKKTRCLGVCAENPMDAGAGNGTVGDEAPFPALSNVGSFTECTGLMPSPPADGDELDAYRALSSMEIPGRDARDN